MSISRPTKSSNPASKFIRFTGDGDWIYFDKSLGDKGQNVKLEPPIFFIILDELTTIKGWSDTHESNFYSNEIHNFNEQLRVKTFKGSFNCIGYYEDIKNDLKAAGARYCKSIYAMIFDKGVDGELVNFQLMGSSLTAYIDAKIKPNSQVISITGENIPKKKGKTDYFVPVFKAYKMDEERKQEAIELDQDILQPYFNASKKDQQSETVEKAESHEHADIEPVYKDHLDEQADSFIEDDDPSDLPF